MQVVSVSELFNQKMGYIYVVNIYTADTNYDIFFIMFHVMRILFANNVRTRKLLL